MALCYALCILFAVFVQVRVSSGSEQPPVPSYTTLQESVGYSLMYKAHSTCYQARYWPACDSYHTCIRANKQRLRIQLENINTYIYWAMHEFNGLDRRNLLCDSQNLPAANSLYQTLRPHIEQKAAIYQYSSLLINYMKNLAGVLNTIYYGHTWLDYSQGLVDTMAGDASMSSLDNLANLTTMGICANNSLSDALISVFPELTNQTRTSAGLKYTSTQMSYCTLCEFCHTVRHLYRLVTGRARASTCSCVSQIPTIPCRQLSITISSSDRR